MTVEVNQADREMSAKLYEWFPQLASSREEAQKYAQQIRDGLCDGYTTVLAFARHRAAERERCARIADEEAQERRAEASEGSLLSTGALHAASRIATTTRSQP